MLQNVTHQVFSLEQTELFVVFVGRNRVRFHLKDQAHHSTPFLNFSLMLRDPRSYFLAHTRTYPKNKNSKRHKKLLSEITVVVSV